MEYYRGTLIMSFHLEQQKHYLKFHNFSLRIVKKIRPSQDYLVQSKQWNESKNCVDPVQSYY